MGRLGSKNIIKHQDLVGTNESYLLRLLLILGSLLVRTALKEGFDFHIEDRHQCHRKAGRGDHAAKYGNT